MYKGGQSEARGMMRSIDLSQNMKQSVKDPMMRMSFSRPAIDQEDEFELPQLV